MERRRMLTTYKVSPIDKDCVALYHFDDNAVDAVDNNAASTTSTSYSTNSKWGKSIYIDGGGIVGKSVSISSNDDFTIDFWANIQYRSGDSNRFFQFTANDSYYVILTHNANNNTSQAAIGMAFSGSISVIFNDFPTVPLNTWHHYAVTYDHVNHLAKLYIDGKIKYIAQWTATSAYYTIYMGRMRMDYSRSMKGYLDEFHLSNSIIWNREFAPPTTPWIIGK